MSTTATTMQSEFRLLVQDTDTTVSSDFSDADVRVFLNYGLLWLYENHEKRVKSVTIDAATLAGDFEDAGDATFIYPEILGMFVLAASASTPLTKLDWNEIKMRQARETDAGTPQCYAAIKIGGGSVAANNQNLWLYSLWPTPSAGLTITAIVRDYPVLLTAGADLVDLGDFEARLCVLIAVVIAGQLKGDPAIAENAMRLLPQWMQAKLETHRVHDEASAA